LDIAEPFATVLNLSDFKIDGAASLLLRKSGRKHRIRAASRRQAGDCAGPNRF
jgi:hypothetical protein